MLAKVRSGAMGALPQGAHQARYREQRTPGHGALQREGKREGVRGEGRVEGNVKREHEA